MAILSSSCSSDEERFDESDLREQLGISKEKISLNNKNKIRKITKPIFFNNIEDAKNFINKSLYQNESSEFKFFNKFNFKESVKKISNKGIEQAIIDGDGILYMSCPPSYFEEFFPQCDDSGGGVGCGSGSVRLTFNIIGNYMRYNVTFNYGSNNNSVTASDFNSNISGITVGISYEHTSTSYSIYSDNTIQFTVQGVQNYNIFVDGVGTVYTENITLRGSYNPCTGSGNVRVLPLVLD